MMITQKNLIITTLFLLTLSLPSPYISTSEEETTTTFGNSIDPKSLNLDKQQTLSHFKFYWQEKLSQPNATSIQLVPPVPRYNTTTNFGLIRAIDIALTIAPNVSSKVVGRAEGVYVSTSESDLEFYWQDIVGGSNATAINVVQPLAKWAQTTLFGEIRVLDNPLTSEPSLSSKVLGRVQGIYVGESQTEPVLFMAGTLVFYEGRFNGSTIHIIARNVVLDKVRENTIVGGTGVFRFAKGYAEARTVTYNAKTGDSTVQYDVYVYHH
ncbi:hypothetical protein PIB30_080539 [Stylosanthes scabra]|uniref:Dirigent protein n=1 Tax=Stylosanthes scabra TaxID=79078 RepID=A0ABU6UQC0_9FABA|nr:hypothetical protein [Stylosanthes scabra]